MSATRREAENVQRNTDRRFVKTHCFVRRSLGKHSRPVVLAGRTPITPIPAASCPIEKGQARQKPTTPFPSLPLPSVSFLFTGWRGLPRAGAAGTQSDQALPQCEWRRVDPVCCRAHSPRHLPPPNTGSPAVCPHGRSRRSTVVGSARRGRAREGGTPCGRTWLGSRTRPEGGRIKQFHSGSPQTDF